MNQKEYEFQDLRSNDMVASDSTSLDTIEDDVIRKDNLDEETKKEGMTTFEAGLAVLSAIIGGGIVGIPYSMYHTGIPAGVFLNLFLGFVSCYAGSLYLHCKDLSESNV